LWLEATLVFIATAAAADDAITVSKWFVSEITIHCQCMT